MIQVNFNADFIEAMKRINHTIDDDRFGKWSYERKPKALQISAWQGHKE